MDDLQLKLKIYTPVNSLLLILYTYWYMYFPTSNKSVENTFIPLWSSSLLPSYHYNDIERDKTQPYPTCHLGKRCHRSLLHDSHSFGEINRKTKENCQSVCGIIFLLRFPRYTPSSYKSRPIFYVLKSNYFYFLLIRLFVSLICEMLLCKYASE